MDWHEAIMRACNAENGMAMFDAVAWSAEDHVLSFRHFGVRWTTVWLDGPEDASDGNDIHIETNGTPSGFDPVILWEAGSSR